MELSMTAMKQFMYARLIDGAPIPGLEPAEVVQRSFPHLNVTVDSLTEDELAVLGRCRVVVPRCPIDGYNYTYGAVEPEDDEWVQRWEQQPSHDREKRLIERSRAVRTDRNTALTASDWTQVADAPLTPEQRTAWSSYRQDLRDLTSQPNFPWEVTWPTAP